MTLPLSACSVKNLVWAAPGRGGISAPPGTVFHLCQFGILDTRLWEDQNPLVEPVCGAASFKRGHHWGWQRKDDVLFEAFAGRGTWGREVFCHACIVQMVLDYREIFEWSI